MVDVSSVISIIIVLIIIIAVFKIFKSVLKTIFIISTLFGIVVFFYLIILYQDVADFKTNFPTSEKLFLLEHNQELIAGFSGVLTEQEEPNYVTSSELNSYKLSYEANDLDNIVNNYYKLFIVNSESFEEVTSVEFGEDDLSREFIFDLIDSETATDDFANYYAQSRNIPFAALGELKKQMKEQFPSDTEFKGSLFASLFSAKTKEDPLFVFVEYKKENIAIHPETMLFKTMKKIPLFLMKRFIRTENGNIG